MEYIPVSKSRRTDLMIFASFILAVCAFCIASFMPSYGGLVQILGLVLLTAAVYLAVRYRLTSFRYVLSDDGDGGVLFTVYRAQGKRSVAECRMSGVYLESVCRRESKKELSDLRCGVSVYDYTASFMPEDICFLVFESGADKKTGVILETDGAFYDALAALAARNAQGRADDEADA